MTVKACSGCGAASSVRLCNVCRSEGAVLPSPQKRTTTTLCAAPETFDGYEREQARTAAIRAEDPAGWAEAIPLHGAKPGGRRMKVGDWVRETRSGR